MDSSMDVLPFSLACDRCDYRTKSISAMRDHAHSHQAMEELTGRHAAGSDQALQALVDSALSDASRLLMGAQPHPHPHQGTPHPHTHQDTGPPLPRSPVEEVGRADSDMSLPSSHGRRGALMQPRQDRDVPDLAAEDLLGIYAAGIDFSVVGGVSDEASQYRLGGNQEGHAHSGHAQSSPVQSSHVHSGHAQSSGSGVSQHSPNSGGSGGIALANSARGAGHSADVLSRTETSHTNDVDVHGLGMIPTSGNSLTSRNKNDRIDTRNPPESRQVGESSTVHDGREVDTSGIENRLPCSHAGDTGTELRSNTTCDSGQSIKSRSSGRLSRPPVQFVIHPSTFNKMKSTGMEYSPPSTSSVPPLEDAAGDVTPVKEHQSPVLPYEARTDTQQEHGSTTCAVRTRGQRSKLACHTGESGKPNEGRRRGRKAACPAKVILPQKKQQGGRGGRVKRPRGRPPKDEAKRLPHRCLVCPFSCAYKRELTAHTKSAHAANSARLGKVRFEIGRRKKSQACIKEDSVKPGRKSTRLAGSSASALKKPTKIVLKRRGRPPKSQIQNISASDIPLKTSKIDSKQKIKRSRGKKQEEPVKDNSTDSEVPLCELVVIDSKDKEEHTEEDRRDGGSNKCRTCDICEVYVADSCEEMRRHKAIVHNDTLRKSDKQTKGCQFCGDSCQFHKDSVPEPSKALKTPPAVKKEQVANSTGRTYPCNICDFTCHSSHLLNSHMKSQHHFEKMSGEFKCDICGKVVVGRYSHFRRHLRCHSDERPYKCDQCPLAFRDANSLNCHTPIHREARDYLCEECGMAFKRPINLRMHRKVHSDKSFACDECDYRCRRRNTLLNHKKRKHLKQKSILCQHCGHCFFSKTECKNHVLKKHTPRPTPFACPVCPAVFMFQYRFKAHLKTHPEIKPYKCSYCGFETRLKSYLIDHMRQHTGEKPKKCSLCDYETSTNSNLYKHKKRHHGPGAQRLPSRPRKLRPQKPPTARDAPNPSVGSVGVGGGDDPGKGRSEKSMVDEIVNAVEFGQLATQVHIAGSQTASLFNMAPMCSTQELKQEMMQVTPVDVHQGPHMMSGEVNVICPVSDPSHDAERLSISILDKTSSVAAMMEALAEARNMRPPPPPPLPPHHQAPPPPPQLSHPTNPYPLHLAVTPPFPAPTAEQTSTMCSTTLNNAAPQTIFPRTSSVPGGNMTMHYVHHNLSTIGGATTTVPNQATMQTTHYHHLTALAGEAANRSPITSHAQPAPHNAVIPPPLIGVGQGQTQPQPLTHFPNMMHF